MFVYQSHQRLLGLIISLCIFISLPLLADLSITEELLDKIEAKYNKFSRQRVTLWQELVSTSDNLTDIEKLELVNKFFNSNVLF
ncbi:MAG: sulfate adenylyltransferase, partial [Gammaproteobacteria bacterium]